MTTITNTATAGTFPFRDGSSRVSLAAFARPADVLAYAANDVVSDSTSVAKAIEFPNCGMTGRITNALLTLGHTVAADFDLYVFDAEPTNFVDNAALALTATDAAKLVGVFRFTTAAKINIATNLEVYRAVGTIGENDEVPRAFASANGKLYGLLVTRTLIAASLSGATVTIRLGVGA